MNDDIKTLMFLQEHCDKLSAELTQKYYGKKALCVYGETESMMKYSVLEIYCIQGQVRVKLLSTNFFGDTFTKSVPYENITWK